jgi:hypothetical protein
LPRGALDEGLRELTSADGLPPLPEIEFVMMYDVGTPGAHELAQAIFEEADARPRTGTVPVARE